MAYEKPVKKPGDQKEGQAKAVYTPTKPLYMVKEEEKKIRQYISAVVRKEERKREGSEMPDPKSDTAPQKKPTTLSRTALSSRKQGKGSAQSQGSIVNVSEKKPRFRAGFDRANWTRRGRKAVVGFSSECQGGEDVERPVSPRKGREFWFLLSKDVRPGSCDRGNDPVRARQCRIYYGAGLYRVEIDGLWSSRRWKKKRHAEVELS